MRRAIASVQAQTCGNWEVIVVDDGSDDDTAAVLAGIAHFDAAGALRSPTERGGVCRGPQRRAGHGARGDYVAFLDSDNTWRPRVPRGDGRRRWPTAAGGRPRGAADLEGRAASATGRRRAAGSSLLIGNYIDLNVLLVRRQLLTEIGGFDESLRRAVDYDLVLRLSRAQRACTWWRWSAPTTARTPTTRAGSASPSRSTWNQVVRGRHLVDWSAQDAEPARRRAGSASSLPVGARARRTVRLDDLLRPTGARRTTSSSTSSSSWSGTASRASQCSTFPACAQQRPVTVAAAPRVRPDRAADQPRASPRPPASSCCWPSVERPARGGLPPLVAALAEPGVAVVQPLMRARRHDRGQRRGGVSVRAASSPHPLLEGFPVSDAERLGIGRDRRRRLAAVRGAAGTNDLIALRGLDPLLGNSLAETDLSLRAREQGLGVSRVVVESRAVVHAQRRAASRRTWRSRPGS